jgi:hypothetical protein
MGTDLQWDFEGDDSSYKSQRVNARSVAAQSEVSV